MNAPIRLSALLACASLALACSSEAENEVRTPFERSLAAAAQLPIDLEIAPQQAPDYVAGLPGESERTFGETPSGKRALDSLALHSTGTAAGNGGVGSPSAAGNGGVGAPSAAGNGGVAQGPSNVPIGGAATYPSTSPISAFATALCEFVDAVCISSARCGLRATPSQCNTTPDLCRRTVLAAFEPFDPLFVPGLTTETLRCVSASVASRCVASESALHASYRACGVQVATDATR